MSDIDIDALRAKAEAASPGPWRLHDPQSSRLTYGISSDRAAVVYYGSDRLNGILDRANAAYIAAMSPDVALRLIDRIRSLEHTAAAAGRALREAQEREAALVELLHEARGWMTPPRHEGEQDTVERISALIGDDK